MTAQTAADMAAPGNNDRPKDTFAVCIKKLLLRHTMENNGRVLEGVFKRAEKRRKPEQ